MDNYLRNIVDTIKESQAASVEAEGLVISPVLFAFRDGRLIGYVWLRPVYRGSDAVKAIRLLSVLAAAGTSNEVLVAWIDHDLARACEYPPPWPSGLTALLVLHARPDRNVLYPFPYESHLLGDASEGKARITMEWMPEPPPVATPYLPPAIADMIGLCWEPPNLRHRKLLKTAANQLVRLGYEVNLIKDEENSTSLMSRVRSWWSSG